jgi:hypothetical protein
VVGAIALPVAHRADGAVLDFEAVSSGASALADAGQFRFEQLFLEQLFRMKKTDARAAKEWHELGKTLAALLGNRQQLETLKGAGGASKKRIDGVAIADKVRRILGVPLPGEPVPGYGTGGTNGGTSPGRTVPSNAPTRRPTCRTIDAAATHTLILPACATCPPPMALPNGYKQDCRIVPECE